MCGILGGNWQQKTSKSDQAIQEALSTLKNRGPNDQGFERYVHHDRETLLGHTRLSVQDTSSAGHQPMHSSDENFTIVFNGEIYNFKELRKELSSTTGALFNSESDTEVLLAAWQHWKEGCLSRLKGMFSFVIYNRQDETLTCVRDQFGIKPFFYTQENKDFLFSSELPALRKLKTKKFELNTQRAYDYLVHGDYDSKSSTFVKDIYQLMPGHLIKLNTSTGVVSAPQQWWVPNVEQTSVLSFSDAADELRERFLDNIKLHLRSDVPLGAALSGGVDSSAVVCAMRKIEPDAVISTFSFIAKDSTVSEESWVDLVNQHVGAKAYKVFVSPHELANDLDDMILAQGEPFGSTSIYAQYRVFKLAKESGITVTLDGQGADELLAGYHGYPSKRIKSMLEQRQYLKALNFAKEWSKWPDRDLKHCLKTVIAECVDGPVYELLRRGNGMRTKPTWIDTDILRESGVVIGYPRQKSPYDITGRKLASELAFSLSHRGLQSLLRHGDRNSMRFSIESRVPFLTSDMADFLLSLPENYLISQQGETKSVFRAAMRGIVPDAILDRRDKIGFSTPEQVWLTHLADQIREWLKIDLGLPFLDQSAILKEFDKIISGKAPFSWQVWRWINFIRWHQHFFG
ncbi:MULTISPECIES: asparagine synthase (glutamine-hydrolyzing) [Pseudomonas]|uniref:asparagine synthase (glutamine-hydrolyzing) n=1 Tax=Pseudomonas protegens TaxID=380021 RepID=A0A9Q6IH43_9PSED|nr:MULTISPECIES: asparagine synthase (glutamine-hydrolyzing) [Pseudomonas]MCO7577723.1 asparagine synthase (glutamine-hydrolyzing) [Pseudomonas protegens]MCO7584098.1 asparagine synthase (glutamine-hydrolyzing) [Pseudomonas chlororaphis]MCO7601106.1 asparagine synthase (glutamine-hydrolyzing) [Pseudomonas chlororaphis]MDC7817314.1 asparagine synthase (glutamine-hydrolyzing) [Pseudomonas sp. BLCC-B112]PYC37324.1 asparagine synthase (glutamine-hydrolyzing) [Pseudomonas protegens]